MIANTVDPCRVNHKHGVSEAFLNYSQEWSRLYQTRSCSVRRAHSVRSKHSASWTPAVVQP